MPPTNNFYFINNILKELEKERSLSFMADSPFNSYFNEYDEEVVDVSTMEEIKDCIKKGKNFSITESAINEIELTEKNLNLILKNKDKIRDTDFFFFFLNNSLRKENFKDILEILEEKKEEDDFFMLSYSVVKYPLKYLIEASNFILDNGSESLILIFLKEITKTIMAYTDLKKITDFLDHTKASFINLIKKRNFTINEDFIIELEKKYLSDDRNKSNFILSYLFKGSGLLFDIFHEGILKFNLLFLLKEGYREELKNTIQIKIGKDNSYKNKLFSRIYKELIIFESILTEEDKKDIEEILLLLELN